MALNFRPFLPEKLDERTEYALVCLAHEGRNKWWLHYAMCGDERPGTGPFPTMEDAMNWYNTGGR